MNLPCIVSAPKVMEDTLHQFGFKAGSPLLVMEFLKLGTSSTHLIKMLLPNGEMFHYEWNIGFPHWMPNGLIAYWSRAKSISYKEFHNLTALQYRKASSR